MRFWIGCVVLLFYIGGKAQEQEKKIYNKNGLYLGLETGTWMPTNSNNPLKTPFMLGLMLDFKLDESALGFNFDMIFVKTKEPLPVHVATDMVATERNLAGVNITLNYSREIFETNRCAFEAIAGLGYGEMTYYNPNADTDVSKGSFLVSPGIGARYMISNGYFLQFKLQYNIAGYHDANKVDADLKGQYLSAKIAFGSRIGN